MAKVISKSSPSYAGGGKGHMAGKTGASPQKSGTTSGAGHGSMSGGWAKGGSGHMSGKNSSTPKKAC